MAEMDGEPRSPDHELLNQPPLKRKSDIVDAAEGEVDRTVKHYKPDSPPLEVLGSDADQVERINDESASQNGNVAEEKAKSVLSAADKGKGKMVLADEEDSDDAVGRKDSSDDEDGSSEDSDESVQGGDGDDDDSDFSDDPLTEVDLDNILPVRIRRRNPVMPGAYLVGDRESDDEDDDSDDGGDDELDDDGDDQEELAEDESKNVGTSEK
ncbi:hypothetical protein KSP40_PGU003732 [Platanthera guangdongensis]|uniref:Histone chaperone domain-containing protein n=1 Tax=Platanthera guangdongensis TaxID=2320717 RepID=A0ABR2N0M0_9ASPA